MPVALRTGRVVPGAMWLAFASSVVQLLDPGRNTCQREKKNAFITTETANSSAHRASWTLGLTTFCIALRTLPDRLGPEKAWPNVDEDSPFRSLVSSSLGAQNSLTTWGNRPRLLAREGGRGVRWRGGRTGVFGTPRMQWDLQ